MGRSTSIMNRDPRIARGFAIACTKPEGFSVECGEGEALRLLSQFSSFRRAARTAKDSELAYYGIPREMIDGVTIRLMGDGLWLFARPLQTGVFSDALDAALAKANVPPTMPDWRKALQPDGPKPDSTDWGDASQALLNAIQRGKEEGGV